MKHLKASTMRRYSDKQLRIALIKRAGYHPDIIRIDIDVCYKFDIPSGCFLFYCGLDRHNTIELLKECTL